MVNIKAVHKRALLGIAIALIFGAAATWVRYSRSITPRQRQIIEVSLGDIAPGKAATGKARIANNFDTTLTVKRILKDCSCVAVDLTRGCIAPGEAAELSFRYNAPSHGGPIEHTLEITYQEQPVRTIVYVTGTVVGWAKTDRDVVDFGEVCVGNKASQVVRVATAEPWPENERVAELTLQGGVIDRVVSGAGQSGAGSLDFHLLFAPAGDNGPKQIRGELVLKWKGRPERILRVPCLAAAVTRCLSEPSSIFFGIVRSVESKRIGVHVTSRKQGDSVDLRTCSLKYDLPPAFTVECDQSEELSLDLTISLKKDRPAVTGLQNGRIRIVGPESEVVLSIPVWAMLKE